MPKFPTEAALWRYMAPRLRGHWVRVEALVPDGIPDCMGFWTGRTHFIELKVGPVGTLPAALRASQRAFMRAAGENGVNVWVALGTPGGTVEWHAGSVAARCHPPGFWRSRL